MLCIEPRQYNVLMKVLFQENGSLKMDEIKLMQHLSRYNNKVEALRQTLGLSLAEKFENIELDPTWITYDSRVQTLKNKLGMSTHDPQLTFHKSSLKEADDTSGQISVSAKQYIIGRELRREVVKHYGHSAVHSLMESYSEGTLNKSSSAPPRQEVVDKVLISRSLAHANRLRNLEEAFRTLESTKGQLNKEIKNLKAQNEFFGNGRKPQSAEASTLSVSTDLRNENRTTEPPGTNFLQGLEMHEALMDDIIKEVMSSNLPYQPQKRDPATSEQIQKLMLEASKDHAVLLTEEEIILEVTAEMSKHLAMDVFRRTALGSEFESHFGSNQVQEYLKNSNPLDF
ncbi:uncharacterized protein [Hyperolius riggenbachi]|uniref:uncharacterized protein isoform X2 n=1 Tax=Hyperolius riggenbachi TaxID=752182 RepID=UPI0035A2F0F1